VVREEVRRGRVVAVGLDGEEPDLVGSRSLNAS
jgi:hypothetical protein